MAKTCWLAVKDVGHSLCKLEAKFSPGLNSFIGAVWPVILITCICVSQCCQSLLPFSYHSVLFVIVYSCLRDNSTCAAAI